MNKLFAPKMDEEDDDMQVPSSITFKDAIWHTQLQRREIIINGTIDDTLIERAVLQIFNFNYYDTMKRETEKNFEPDPIKIYINTFGGAIDETFSLVSAIESSATPIMTIAMGKCMSAGMLILMSGHARIAQKYSNLMLHQFSSGMHGEYKNMIEYAEYCQQCHNKMISYINQKCKIPKKMMDKMVNNKHDWYITPEEALKMKIIDEIF